MKIAFLFTQLEVGGAQTRVMQTANELRARGHSVDVFSIYQARPCFEDEEKTILSASKRPQHVLMGIFRLWRKLRAEKYDAFITNTAPANIIGNAVAFFAGQRRRISWQTQPPERINKLFQTIDHLWGSLGIYNATVANSAWTRSCFNGRRASYLRRMRTIMNGITPRVDMRSKSEARDALGIQASERVIVTVGRLSKQKGQDTLIRAMALIQDARLYVVGDGELRQELQHLAVEVGVADRVMFVGEIPGEMVATYLRAADIFAFPSRWETFGLAVIEAAGSGIPIISSDLDVLKEVLSLEDGKICAAFFPVDDAVELSEKVNFVLSSQEEAVRLGGLSLQVSGRHTLERHVDKILDLISDLPAGRKDAGKAIEYDDLKAVHPDMGQNPASFRRALVDLAARRSPAGVAFWLEGRGEAGAIPLQDHADIVYTFAMLDMADQIPADAAEKYAAHLADLRLFARAEGKLPASGKPVNAHLTAYLLAAVRLLEQHGKLVPPPALYTGWQLDQLIDKRKVPLWPWPWTHHIWRVSHWIGGIPSILLHLAHSGHVKWATEDLVQEVLSASEKHIIDARTGLLRPYRVQLIQNIFRALYRLRHDPDLGDLGGVVHILWVYHALGRPYAGADALRLAAERELARNRPFMEDVPYCLDFDVIQLERTVVDEAPAEVKARAAEFIDDTVAFFCKPVASTYSLHKIPGALASIHECAWLTGEARVRGIDVPRIDIIKRAYWL
ncbi:MAG: glycosyltransferase family 4 protein [Alphaproteobacteria bacterium]